MRSFWFRGGRLLVVAGLLAAGLALVAEPASSSSVPAQPTLRFKTGDQELYLLWLDPGDSTITHWEYSRKAAESDPWGAWTDIPDSNATTTEFTLTGVTDSHQCLKLRAVNGNGNGVARSAGCLSVPSKYARLSASNLNVTEGDSGYTEVVLTLELSENAPSGGLTMHVAAIATDDASAIFGTAIPSWHCQPEPGPTVDICMPPATVRFSEGTKTKTITLRIVGDGRVEDDETIYISAYQKRDPSEPPTQEDVFTRTWGGGKWLVLTIVDDDGVDDDGVDGDDGGDSDDGTVPTNTPTSTTTTTAPTSTTTANEITGATGSGNVGAQLSISTNTTTAPAPSIPKKPKLTVRVRNGVVYLTWTAPSDQSIVRWEYRYRSGKDASWSMWTTVPDSNAATTEYTLRDVTGERICLQLVAANVSGRGIPSDEVCVNLGDTDSTLSTSDEQRLALMIVRMIKHLLASR